MISDPKKTSELGGQSTVSEHPKETTDDDRAAHIDPWFDQQITQLYGEVADEPIPPELLDLVKKLKSPH